MFNDETREKRHEPLDKEMCRDKGTVWKCAVLVGFHTKGIRIPVGMVLWKPELRAVVLLGGQSGGCERTGWGDS